MRWMIWAGCALALSGCAELREWSCASTDAVSLGERLGRQGASEAALAQEVAICAQTAAPLRMDLARQGFAAGRRAHCTPAVALENGRAGRDLGSFCPAAALPALAEAHRRGQLVREIEWDLQDLYRQEERLEARLRDQRNAAESGEDGDASADDRRATRRNLRRVIRRIERLEDRKFLLLAGAAAY